MKKSESEPMTSQKLAGRRLGALTTELRGTLGERGHFSFLYSTLVTNGHLNFIINFIFRAQNLPSSLFITHMMLLTLMILGICRTRVTYEPSKWPSSPRVSRSIVETRTQCCGHIVTDTNVSLFARAGNICCGHKFCVRDTKNVSDKCFPVCAAWAQNKCFV